VAVYAADASSESPLSVPPHAIALTVSVLVTEGLELPSYVVPALHVPSALQVGVVPSFVKQIFSAPVDDSVSTSTAVMAPATGSKVTSLGVHVYAAEVS